MPVFDSIPTGAPCWIDLSSGDLEACKPMYEAAFGWTFKDQGEEFGNYNIITIGDDVVGGAMQHNPEFMGPNPANAWTIYFAAEDVAAQLDLAVQHGGKITTPAMQVMDQGAMGEATDPVGDSFGFWQPAQLKGFDRWGEHGFPAWFELKTRDFDAASAFYSNLLGAELGMDEMGEGMRYHTLNINGESVAGIWDVTDVMPDDAPTGWNVYVFADDPDAAVEAVRQHGGTVFSELRDTPHGRIAAVADACGAAFTIVGGAS